MMQIGQDKIVKVMMGTNVLYEPSSWKPFNFTDAKGAGSGYYAFADGVLIFKSQMVVLKSKWSQNIDTSPTLFCQLPDEFIGYKVVAEPSGGFAVSGGSVAYYGDAVTSIDATNRLFMDMRLYNGASGYATNVNLAGLQISCERK